MEFKDLIAGLGRTIGIELEIDAENACVLRIDEMIVTIQKAEASESLFIYSEIGEPPESGVDELQSIFMRANHLYKGTSGATISRAEENGAFYLFQNIALREGTVELLVKTLEKFVNTLEVWQHALADFKQGVNRAQGSNHEDVALPQGFMRI